jgi:LuxR family transcriptional regulator, maltose regulon positive regulatory protein
MTAAEPSGPPLLAGKLAAPPMPGRVVARPRLFALLDQGVRRPVTLVAAPAGSGKTLLLASWAAQASAPGPVAWLSLDPADNDPARCWGYVLAALGATGALPAGDRPPDPPAAAADGGLPAPLVQALGALASPVVLVLDDVHELTDPRVLGGLELLVRHTPPRLRLVLVARADPPLPLHRLLVAGQLAQLRAADLAFSVAEVAELLDGYDFRASLSDADLAVLQARTEGWAAGLRLAAVSMQGHPDPRRFVLELAGDDRSLAGYLVAEVLDRLPAELRGFLVRTSVVDELGGGLADALTGRDDGERTLARLERANVFVTAVGQRRDRYRYHPLFAELLRYELRREAPREVAELRGKAADWYGANGFPAEAVGQAVAMGDWERTADLLAEHGGRRLLRGQEAALKELLDQVPAEAARSHPELALLAAAGRIVADDGAEASLELARAQERRLAGDRPPRLALLLAACRLRRAGRAGDLDEALAAGRAALAARDRLGDADPGGVATDALSVSLAGLGAAELWTGELDAAEAHLRAGQVAALSAGLDEVQQACLSHLALVQAVQGRLGDAAATGRAAVGRASPAGVPPAPPVAALLALAWVHYQHDDLAGAGRWLGRAAEAPGAAQDRPLRVTALIIEGWLARARSDPAAAFAALGAARHELSGWARARLLVRWLATSEAELHLAAGDTATARGLLAALDLAEPAPAAPPALAVARLRLAEGDPDAALASLAPLVDDPAPAAGAVAAWLLQALARHALDAPDQAAASLAMAAGLAEPEDQRRVFLDAGAPARALLARYRDWVEVSWPFLDEVAHAAIDPAASVSPMPVLVETLSPRERAVLRYLPTMLTFVEIGSELYISVNTTKSHVRSIYRKLGVVGRRDAVRRARQLQLLRS